MESKIANKHIKSNLALLTREEIQFEMLMIESLTQIDKENFDLAIRDAKIKGSSFCCFTGGWYCKPLKIYAEKMGYKITCCGNGFDLWVKLN